MYYEDLWPADPEIVQRFRERSWENYDSGLPVFYVGWLEESHPYSQGRVSSKFVKALRNLCHYPSAMYKGFHVCDFCGATPRIKVYPRSYGLKLEKPRKSMSGSHDIEVIGKDAVYYAPGLILHYVEQHNYLPPQEFIKAVLAAKIDEGRRGRAWWQWWRKSNSAAKTGEGQSAPGREAHRLTFAPDEPYRLYWQWPIKRTLNAQGLFEEVFIFRHENHARMVQNELLKSRRSCTVGEMNLEKWVQGEVNIKMGKLRPTGPSDSFPRLQSAFYLHAFAGIDEDWSSIDTIILSVMLKIE